MKTRILMGVLAIVMAAALIAGATMAWFTDSTEVPTAQFTAGTVEVNVDEEPDFQTMEGRSIHNVNPGDCARVTWTIVNEGTKKAELRVKLDEAWEGELSTDNVYYAPVEGSKWVMYDEDGEIWLYYTGGPVRGTYNYENDDPENPLEPATVDLTLVVAFDGAATGNEYQGKEFTLSGEVQAIQATNGAPAAEWGDAWTDVTSAGYAPSGLAADYLEYCQGTPCWSGEGGGGGDEGDYLLTLIPNNAEYGSVEGGGHYDAGTAVTLVATPNPGYVFDKWTTEDGTEVSDVNPYIMPAGDITLIAVFKPAPPTEYTLALEANPAEGGTVSGAGSYAAGTEVTVTATANEGYTFVNWTRDGAEVSDQASFTYTMPGEAATLVANFEPIPKYTVTVQIQGKDGATGTVTGAGQYAAGETVTLTATPGSYTWMGHTFYYKFDKWTGYGISGYENDNPYTFTMPAQNVEFTAHFKKW